MEPRREFLSAHCQLGESCCVWDPFFSSLWLSSVLFYCTESMYTPALVVAWVGWTRKLEEGRAEWCSPGVCACVRACVRDVM